MIIKSRVHYLGVFSKNTSTAYNQHKKITGLPVWLPSTAAVGYSFRRRAGCIRGEIPYLVF